MGHRRSAYPWMQRIPANPQTWYDANVNRLTPNILSGANVTSCSLNREIQGTYGFWSVIHTMKAVLQNPWFPLPATSLSLLVCFVQITVMFSVLPSSPLSPPLIPTALPLYFFEPHNPSDPHHNQMSSGSSPTSIFMAWDPCHTQRLVPGQWPSPPCSVGLSG